MKLNTTWNLQLIYKDQKNPPFEKDIVIYEKAVDAFEKKYRTDTAYLQNENDLKQALTEYESLYGMVEPRRAYAYFHYRKETNSTDQEAEKKLNLISERLTKAGNKTLFFELALGKIDKQLQD